MVLVNDSKSKKTKQAKKMMLWFAIISIVMMFAGFTSAYVVSSSRPDWVQDLQLPTAFSWSTAIIILSSIALFFSKRLIGKGDRTNGSYLLWLAFALGVGFVILQFVGFSQFISEGYFFTGAASTINTSMIYVVVLTHIVHVIAGLVVLLVVIYNHYKQKYKPGQMLGIELGATFWHFVDILWLYLFLFFIF